MGGLFAGPGGMFHEAAKLRQEKTGTLPQDIKGRMYIIQSALNDNELKLQSTKNLQKELKSDIESFKIQCQYLLQLARRVECTQNRS
jgi:hypothetical protein